MLRRVLTAYLAFLTAAAPCLCCCTTGRLVAATPPAAECHSLPAAKSCCCNETDPPATQQPAPKRHMPAPEERCPCRNHADMQAQVTVDAKADNLDLRRVSLEAVTVVLPNSDPSPSADHFGLAHDPDPFLSATDLLHVHHRLRC